MVASRVDSGVKSFRIDRLTNLVFGDAVKANAELVQYMVNEMSWIDFKMMLTRSTGILNALVVRGDGMVSRLTVYNGYASEAWHI